ncbi:hypothetical protein K469DRAFT_753087 [Zopfia rhizophila CBS 207.26]|uniref:Uncharacterized protein n=1 Tax=Zopfia rhizophila CBS 207.26 TaxID=1314779 RepID=A0A6A6DQP1_9PEZI|nr:hypothetical protein K469DRAFT_753087 [Zopfia rhizophila CBS 207.26]
MSPSKDPASKKRPPPIQVPQELPPTLPRVQPGPNAFAIMAKAQGQEMERQREGGDERRSTNQTPVTSPVHGTRPESHLPRSDFKARKHESNMTTMTQLIEHSRAKSPRKSDGHASSTTSRHGSSTRSRRSQRSRQGGASSYKEDDERTLRGHIESRTEKKFFKMMGQIPPTPSTSNSENNGVTVSSFDFSDACKAPDATEKKPEEPIKSPRKKILGMSIPSFMSSASTANQPTPPMPSKAAKVLGTSPSKNRRGIPRPLNAAVRSDTSKSLPVKLYDHHSHSRRPNPHGSMTRKPSEPSPLSRWSHNRTPSRKTHSTEKGVHWKDLKRSGESDIPSPGNGSPPTPPEKDTPPDAKDKKMQVSQVKLTHRTVTKGETQQGQQNQGQHPEDEEATIRLPNFARAEEVIPAERGVSPTKFGPYGAEDYATLIDGEHIQSAHALVDYADGPQNGGHHTAPLEGERNEPLQVNPGPNGRWSEIQAKNHKRYIAGRFNEQLPPAFYSPSNCSIYLENQCFRPSKNIDKDRYLFAFPPRAHSTSMSNIDSRGSIDMIFQGSASEIDPDSNTGKVINAAIEKNAPSPQKGNESSIGRMVMQEIRNKREDSSSQPSSNAQYLQPEQSSSRLTDMLNGVSPSKTGYNTEFYPNPSALPSPLYGNPSQQMPPPMMAPSPMNPPHPHQPGTLADGSNILSHFYMANEHMDVVGRSLYDLVENSKHEQIVTITKKHKETVRMLQERAEDIKTHVNLVGQNVEHMSEQSEVVNSKLDRLIEFIKEEVVGPLAVQANNMADMENEIKAMQKAMQDMQKLMESKSNAIPDQPLIPQATQPYHRSQPSLVGYYGSPSDSGRDGLIRMASTQEIRNDGRFRYGSMNGQNWFRPNQGRENRQEMHPFSVSPPFGNNGPGQFGSGYMGGYLGYNWGGPTDQDYGYNPSDSK